MFLGYKPGIKGYVLYDLHTREIFVSRNVIFHENILPYSTTKDCPVHDFVPSISPSEKNFFDDIDLSPSTAHDSSSQGNAFSPNLTPILDSDIPLGHGAPNHDQSISDTLHSNTSNISPNHDQSISNTSPSNISNIDTPTQTSNNQNTLRNSARVTSPPLHLKDFICNPSPHHSNAISSGTLYPLSSFHSYSNLSPSQSCFSLSVSTYFEPHTYVEAVKSPCWVQAMNDELVALEKNGTWKIVEMPPGVKPIGSKWVYKVKHKVDGSVERFKVRLVAKGYSQVEGLDYFDTFSHVEKLTTVRMVLALASINHWHLHQLDVNNAFLHGDLQEGVDMTIPEGVQVDKPNLVCKLQKSLYGLKQASRKWYEKLTSLLIQQGYSQANFDHSLFTKSNGESFTVLLVYEDDVILAGNSMTEFKHIKTILDTSFKIKDSGSVKYFLGLKVTQSKKGITVCQRKYCLDLIKDSGLLGSKPVSTPFDPSIKLHQDKSAAYTDISTYRRLIGRLLYLTTTRPYITFIVQQLSQFLSKPTQVHYQAACRVIRYLKGSPGRGLMFSRDSKLQIFGFSDADWAGCLDTRKSVTGMCFFL